jgi:small-conductance mechanosensitive channel
MNGVLVLLTSFGAAWVVRFVFEIILKKAMRRTKTKLDDKIIKVVKNPIFWSVLLYGTYLSLSSIVINPELLTRISNFLFSFVILVWGRVGFKLSNIIFREIETRQSKDTGKFSDAIPFLDNLAKVSLLLIIILSILGVWGVNITPVLASAGVLGIAVAFAAKDTISNLFGGISVFFDKPYKIGDYVIIEQHYRGEVIEIGMRSTKIKTRDSILITVPNSVMVTNAVINETGFDPKLRIRIPMGVAYNSDLDKVEYTLIEVMKSHKEVIKEPVPRIRFRRFGESAIELEALCIIDEPANRGRVMHELLKEIDKAFKEEKISMPFPQRDVHLSK